MSEILNCQKKNFKLPSWIINQKNLKQHVTVEKSRHFQRFYSIWFSIYMTAYTQYSSQIKGINTLKTKTQFFATFPHSFNMVQLSISLWTFNMFWNIDLLYFNSNWIFKNIFPDNETLTETKCRQTETYNQYLYL